MNPPEQDMRWGEREWQCFILKLVTSLLGGLLVIRLEPACRVPSEKGKRGRKQKRWEMCCVPWAAKLWETLHQSEVMARNIWHRNSNFKTLRTEDSVPRRRLSQYLLCKACRLCSEPQYSHMGQAWQDTSLTSVLGLVRQLMVRSLVVARWPIWLNQWVLGSVRDPISNKVKRD